MLKKWLYFHAATLIILPPFLIGTVHVTTQLFIVTWASLFAILTSLRFARRTRESRRIFIDGWFWFLLFFFFLTLLQWIPLPRSLIQFISPQTDFVYQHTLGNLGIYGKNAWATLSLAPGNTAFKLVRDIGLLILWISFLQWTQRSRHLLFIMKISVLSATGMATLTLLQTIFGMPNPLIGFYHPQFPNWWILKGSPFINLNHLGAYLLMNALLNLPLLFHPEEKKHRPFWLISLFILSITIILSLSRGTVLAYLVGIILFWILFWKTQQRSLLTNHDNPTDDPTAPKFSRRSSHSLLQNATFRSFLIFFIIAILLGLYWGSELIYRHFSQTDLTSKKDKFLFILQSSQPLLKNYPTFGVGRGAMPMAWQRFASPNSINQGQLNITHVESFLVQPFIDWGWLFGALFLILFSWLFLSTWRKSYTFAQKSILIALFAVLLQNFADFNLAFLGVAAPFFILLAAVQRHNLNRTSPPSRSVWIPFSLGLLGILFAIPFSLYAYKHYYPNLRSLWTTQIHQKRPKTPQELTNIVRKLAKHHPSDYLLMLYNAQQYLLFRPWMPKQALLHLDIVKFLNPTSLHYYLLKGYIFARLGLFPDATEMLSYAMELAPQNGKIKRSIARTIEDFHFWQQALLHSKSQKLSLFLLKNYSQFHLPRRIIIQTCRKIIPKSPLFFENYRLLISILLQEYSQHPQKRKALLRDIKNILRRMPEKLEKSESYTLLILGKIAFMQKKWQLAANHFRHVLQTKETSFHWSARVGLLWIYLKLKKKRAFFQEWAQASKNRPPHQLAELYYIQGKWYEREFDYRRAKQAYESALQFASNDIYWLALGKVCEETSNYRCSLRSYRYLLSKKRYAHLKKKIPGLLLKLHRLQ